MCLPADRAGSSPICLLGVAYWARWSLQFAGGGAHSLQHLGERTSEGSSPVLGGGGRASADSSTTNSTPGLRSFPWKQDRNTQGSTIVETTVPTKYKAPVKSHLGLRASALIPAAIAAS